MLRRDEIIRLIVGLRSVNDLDLIRTEPILRNTAPESEWQKVILMSELVDQIFSAFSYQDSPEFLDKVAGTSEQTRAFHVRAASAKVRETTSRLASSLITILDSDEAYRLVPELQHKLLDNLRSVASSIQEQETPEGD